MGGENLTAILKRPDPNVPEPFPEGTRYSPKRARPIFLAGPYGSLISPGFFCSSLVMLVGSYESAQDLCRGLEQGFGPRIFHLAHVLAQVIPDVAQHTPYLDRVVTRIALRVPLSVLTHKNPPSDGHLCLVYPLRALCPK